MKVLLLAPSFYGLHTQIIKAMEDLGIEVSFIPDKVSRFDPNFEGSPLKLMRPFYNYIKSKKFLENSDIIIKKKWDVLFCINGYSLNKKFIEKITKFNPKIKKILYLWDSLNFYNFSRNFALFDKIYTFDPDDSKEKHLKYLPLFWTKDCKFENCRKDIDISFIGTQHTIRYRLLSKVVKLLDNKNIKYNFNLIVNKKEIRLIDHLKYLFYYFKKNYTAIGFKDEYLIRKGEIKENFIRFIPLDSSEVSQIIQRSKCILDLAKPNQKGFTNRMIEALGRGKRVITNVPCLSDSKYVSPLIQNIDINNPEINFDFIKDSNSDTFYNVYDELYINNWLRTIIYSE